MKVRTFVALAAACAVCVLGLASASGAGGASGQGLPTDAQIDDLLRSLGIDPAKVVKQRGLQNYSGPSCPGIGWNCTTASQVVQVAPTSAGENRADCRAKPDDGAVTGTDDACVVMQFSVSGENHAWCQQQSSVVPTAVLSCKIVQGNETGGNHAIVRQVIAQNTGASQTATDFAEVDQDTEFGNNQTEIGQDVRQFTSASGNQTQTGTLTADIDQHSTFGRNQCGLNQYLGQDGRGVGTANQTQNGEQDGAVFQVVGEEGEGGPTVASPSTASGNSTCQAHQHENKTLVGNGTQIQFGPQDCCATQIGGGTVHIHQDSAARASQPTAQQDLDTTGRYGSGSDGSIVHHLRIDEDRITAHESGPGPKAIHSFCTSTEAADYYETPGCFSEDLIESAVDLLIHDLSEHPI